MTRLFSVVVVVLLSGLLGCSRSLTDSTSPAPGLQVPFPSAHEAAGLTEYVINGAAAEQLSPGAVPQGSALVLSAAVGGYEYALYRFNPGTNAPDSVSVLLEESVTTGAWIGLADYDAQRWEFSGPYLKQKTLLADEPKYISPGGNIWVAVIAPGAQSATVNALSVRTINPANLPPAADVQADVASGDAPLTVNFDASASSDSDGTIVEYAWDFDDDGLYDGFSDQPLVSHTFSSPGLFSVRMRVTDEQFARASVTVDINVTVAGNGSPFASFTRNPTSGDAPLEVDFDGSASGDPDGPLARFDWDLDGNGTWEGYDSGPQVSNTYSMAGIYTARLRVTDSAGEQHITSHTVTVNVPGNSSPTADVDATPVSGDAPLDVDFDASASSDSDGSIVKYEWDWDGDGLYDAYGDASSASHTYNSAGIFDATLRVTDDAGAQATASVEINISVAGNSSPTADISATPTSGDAPLEVDFDASGSSDSDGSIVRYDWDFDGNGTWDAYDSGDTVSHTYASAGIFDATVRVTDNTGAQDTASVEINVSVAGNSSPTADMVPDNDIGSAPFSVDFDGSGSSDSDGTIVRYDWDFDSDGIWDAYDAGNSVSHTYSAYGSYTAKLRVTDDAGAQDTATHDISVNALPVAALETDTPKVNKGETVYLDAGASDDADGTLADYEWDLDGDGIFNETGVEADQQGESLAALTAGSTPGTIDVSVRVTDDAGSQASATLEITVRGWLILTVDSTGIVGWDTSLALVDGKPAISYYDDTNLDLKYAYSSAPDGSSGWTALVVDNGNQVGRYSSLAVVNGKPAISYSDDNFNDLKYAYTSFADGSGGWTAITVDSAGSTGNDTSLRVVNGKPAISYQDGSNFDLRYAYSSVADGSSGWTALTVDSTGSVGGESSLAIVNGKPAISYRDATSSDLKYAYSSAADGSSGWTALTVDSTGSVGNYSSLAVVGGKPAISYWDATNLDLKYAYSSTADGAGGWSALTVDSVGSVGSQTSLAVVDGKPAISYYDDANIDMKYACSDMDNGSGDWTTQVVDSAGLVGSYTSLAVINGRPAVSYYHFGNSDLKYAVFYE